MLDNEKSAVQLRAVPVSDVGQGGDHFCGIALVSGDVVSGDLVGNQPEERSQRERAATHLGAGQL